MTIARWPALLLLVLAAAPAVADTATRPLTTAEAVALLARTPLPACDDAALQILPGATRNPAQLGCAFDRQGAEVYALLEKAVLKGPVGPGVTFELTIAPDGSVRQVDIVDGSASVRLFERELVDAISRFSFPAQAVKPWTGRYSVNIHHH